MSNLAVLSGLVGRQRPAPTIHNQLPPFDSNDSGGIVHTTAPPELILPSGLDMRADFNGVTLDTSRWGGDIPFLLGANSTPINMLMSPMLILYPRKWQDAYLTESAERNYTNIIIVSEGWNLSANNFNPTPANITSWAKYIKSWGFKIILWSDDPLTLKSLIDNHAVDWVIPGTEVDRYMTAEQFELILDNTLDIVSNGIPVGAHFSSNYPSGFPRDTFLTNWNKYDGRVHLCWQTDPNDSAGTMGARLYYARQRVALGTIGGNGQLALNSKVYAFETLATKQLYGQATEEVGCLRTLELLYTTREDDRIPALAGFGNGCRYLDGSWI